jgi:adenosylcobinamide amidohydrolase
LSEEARTAAAHWEELLSEPTFVLRRSGRFLVADLLVPHAVLSTSVRHGGLVHHVQYLLNHQSCEGTGHHERHRVMVDAGLDAYHDRACEDASLPADRTAMMGTAANMNYTAVVREEHDGLSVTAAVTAGVEGNATTAGEPASWREGEAGIEKVPADERAARVSPRERSGEAGAPASEREGGAAGAKPPGVVLDGTINTILIVNRPLTPGALARAVVTMTEGKSAALQRLAVPSRRHVDLATGTGTDQYCLAAPIGGARPLTSASPHMKLGELIGLATRNATLEALRWQNGLEMSYTRGLFHALGRYGVREATIFEDLAPFLDEPHLELLRKNAKSAFYEPLVGAAAHAMAAVCDRVRHGTVPGPVGPDAMTQQAASIAASLAAQVHRWAEFRAALRPHAGADVKALVLRAIALGWSEKWRTR